MLKKISTQSINNSRFLCLSSKTLLCLILLGGMNQAVIADKEDNCKLLIGNDYTCTKSQRMYGCQGSKGDWGSIKSALFGIDDSCFTDRYCSDWAGSSCEPNQNTDCNANTNPNCFPADDDVGKRSVPGFGGSVKKPHSAAVKKSAPGPSGNVNKSPSAAGAAKKPRK